MATLQEKSKCKRKSISKKLRFEVFKRDKFTCQYCGRKAPDVVLQIDHISPVSKGGKNVLIYQVSGTWWQVKNNFEVLVEDYER